MIDVVPARYEHLPALRLLFGRMVAERAEARYPVIDEEELERFVLMMADRIDDQHQHACCLVAEAEGRLLGFASAQLAARQVGKPRTFCFYEWIAVVPGLRKSGIGRGLIEAVVVWAEARGQTTIEGNATATTAPEWLRRGFHDPLTRGVITTAEARQTLLVPEPERPPVGATAIDPTPPVRETAPRSRAKKKNRTRPRANGHAPEPQP